MRPTSSVSVWLALRCAISVAAFMDVDELAPAGPALVLHPRLDVELVGVPESLREPRHAGRTIGIDRGEQARRPGIVGEQAPLGIVVGVVMGDEGVAQRRQR